MLVIDFNIFKQLKFSLFPVFENSEIFYNFYKLSIKIKSPSSNILQ